MLTQRTSSKHKSAAGLAAVLAAAALVVVTAGAAVAQDYASNGSAPAGAQDNTSYGYLRLVEGSATLTQGGSGSRAAAEINQPIMAGDRLQVPSRGRIEAVLADHNIVRLDGGSEVVFERLAASSDRNDPSTLIRLLEGNMQLVVTQGSLGQEMPAIETPNASIYVQDYGAYRISSEQGNWSEVVVRSGSVQVVAASGETPVSAGSEAVIQGTQQAAVDLRAAGRLDRLETWGSELENGSRVAGARYVDEGLRYQAAPLDRYGHWVDVDNTEYWRPDVGSDWRPYSQGYWDYTPSGATWVSSEPWGYVPYHYGTWDYLPAQGWAWRPGYVYSPAWVYWYWSPSYVGWCPVGYYTNYYASRFYDPSFRFGVYGWAGGGGASFGIFANWNFVSVGVFGRHDLGRWAVPGDRLRDRALERGLITTDTRGISPRIWNDGGQVVQALARPTGGRRLPDVTPFVARQASLPDPVVRSVIAQGGQGGGRFNAQGGRFATATQLAGTPLRPSTLGARPNGGAGGGHFAAGAPAAAAGGQQRFATQASPRPAAPQVQGGRPGSFQASQPNRAPFQGGPSAGQRPTAQTAPRLAMPQGQGGRQSFQAGPFNRTPQGSTAQGGAAAGQRSMAQTPRPATPQGSFQASPFNRTPQGTAQGGRAQSLQPRQFPAQPNGSSRSFQGLNNQGPAPARPSYGSGGSSRNYQPGQPARPTYQAPTARSYQAPSRPSYQSGGSSFRNYQPGQPGQPARPSYQPPTARSYQAPSRPSYQSGGGSNYRNYQRAQPARPSYQAPTTRSYQAPARPSYQAPSRPSYQPPTARSYQAPAPQPRYQAPARPSYQAPAPQRFQAPAPQPRYQAPARPSYQAPSRPSYQAPAPRQQAPSRQQAPPPQRNNRRQPPPGGGG